MSLQDDARLENTLPVVTALAFVIQETFNSIVNGASDSISDDGQDQADRLGEQSQAFMVSELCRLALHLDYADEIGRRKMFGLARECRVSIVHRAKLTRGDRRGNAEPSGLARDCGRPLHGRPHKDRKQRAGCDPHRCGCGY